MLNKTDSERQAILITGVLSGEEQTEQSFGCGANYARGSGGAEENSSRAFFPLALPRS